MSIAFIYARYIHKGDSIPHPSRNIPGIVTTVNFIPASETPGRPWGVVSGWMQNPENPSMLWAWSYPADQLVVVERAK